LVHFQKGLTVMDQVLLRVIGLVCVLLASTSQFVLAKDAASKPINLSCGAKSQEACRTWADELYEREEFNAALSLYTELCANDYPYACHSVGYIHAEVFIENPVMSIALESYEKGCKLNYPSSCHNLGVAYEFWEGVDEPVEKVVALYTKGCELNYANSCYNLAINYEEGDGVKQSDDKYLELNKKSCTLKEARGCEVVGDHYDGTGDMKQSLKFHLMGCELNYAYSCQQTAWKYGYDLGDERDFALYYKYNVMACEMSDGAACRNAGRVLLGYTDIRDPKAPLDEAKGLALVLRACEDYEFSAACGDAASAYEDGDGTKVDLTLSHQLYTRGCDSLDPPNAYSCYKLGHVYFDGNDVIDVDEKRSEYYFQKTCDLGDEDGCDQL